MTGCPTEEQLAGFEAGACVGEEISAIQTHVSSCPDCREWLSGSVHDDQLLPRLRRLMKDERESGELLNAGSRAESPLDDSAIIAPVPAAAIEGYEIREELGRGGMGVVYKALQHATKREVALKVMLEGPFASKASKRRFEREVELAAQLNHSGIVTILDSGIARGRYFFAMEYVDGRRLDEHVTSRELGISDKLRLFGKICDAVSFAHQRGVIHRDLKPSNILVDSQGEPHILDFGLARATDAQAMNEASLAVSITGQVVGTLRYMSPEQASGSVHDLDVRSDVYALGVILYEMLTGTYPYPILGRPADVLVNIVEADPKPPSAINSQVNDEVETILLKTLSKKKDRRYQSVEALARDVRYYLADEPIEAKRDSTMYVLRKTLSRYRVPVAVTAGFVFLLVLSVVAVYGLYVRAERESSAHQRLAYVGQVASAQRAYENGQVKELRRHLSGTPTELRGWEWHRLNWLADRSRLTMTGHEGVVKRVAFSPDGRHVASGGADHTVRIWNLLSGKEVRRIAAHQNTVTCVAYSPDGMILASASEDETLKYWNVQTRELLAVAPHGAAVASLAFSPDGTYVVSGAHDGRIRLWSSSTGELLTQLPGHEDSVQSVAFNRDGTRIVSGAGDGTITVWDVASREHILSIEADSTGIDSAGFSPDGKWIVSSGEDNDILLWSTETGEQVGRFEGHRGSVVGAQFSSDGKILVSGGSDHTVRLWDVATRKEILALRGHNQEVRCIALKPDGTQLVSGSYDGTVKVWNTDEADDHLNLTGHWWQIVSLAVSSDGRLIASGGREAIVRVWNLQTGEEVLALRKGIHAQPAVAFSPRGDMLAVSTKEFAAQIISLDSGASILRTGQHEQLISALAFNQDGSQLASAGLDGKIDLWDAETGRLIQSMDARASVLTLAYRPDGTRIASGQDDGTLKVWRTRDGHELLDKLADVAAVLTVAYDTGGRRVVTGGREGAIRIWNGDSGDELRTLIGHEDAVTAVDFSSDDTRVVSGSTDRSVRLWDTKSGSELLRIEAHDESVSGVTFSPDDDQIISCGNDSLIKIWLTDDPSVETLSQIREVNQAREIVDSLFDEVLIKDEVVARLKLNTSLDEDVRQAALRLAYTRGDEPIKHNIRAWRIVSFANHDIADYQRALRMAQAACILEPDNRDFRNTLGVAQYRVGLHEKALATLCNSGDAATCISECAEAYDVGFIAMALHRLGQLERAKTAFQKFLELVEAKEDSHTQLTRFQREAEELILGSDTPR